MANERNLRDRKNTVSYKEPKAKATKSINLVSAASDKSIKTGSLLNKRLSTSSNPSLTSSGNRSSIVKTTKPPAASENSIKTGSALNKRLSTASNSALTSFSNRSSIGKTTRPPVVNQSDLLLERINQLEARIKSVEDNNNLVARIVSLEAVCSELQSENSELKLTIARINCDIENLQFVTVQSLNEKDVNNIELKTTVTELTSDIKSLNSRIDQHNEQFQETQTLAEKGISFEQQKLNTNIIIRGVEVRNSASKQDLFDIYNRLREHLGLTNIVEFEAVSVNLLSNNCKITEEKDNFSNTIQVILPSISAKRQFLQLRRAKKDITPARIGVTQKSSRPLLITEELTKSNQELLYAARSLRDSNNYKFVWSTDGQILVRQHPRSKVIRIIDICHLNHLKTNIQLENGRIHTTIDVELGQCNTQV